MIPSFPSFKKLELSDKADIEAYTSKYPLYSDFEFESLWVWDVKAEMEISELNGNLVVKFTDYTTGEPFLSFLGDQAVDETAQSLLEVSMKDQEISTLHLVPEIAASELDPLKFVVQESRDHFDYVCEVNRHLAYEAPELKSHRKLLRQFNEAYPGFERAQFDMTKRESQEEITDVYRRWDQNKGFITLSEAFAYDRFLSAADSLAYSAVGIRVDGELVAFHIVSLPPGTCASALFGKADVRYRGIYPALDMVVAEDLLARGYTHMNIQQDLGMEGLRNAKLALKPAYFLKKYSVRRAVNDL